LGRQPDEVGLAVPVAGALARDRSEVQDRRVEQRRRRDGAGPREQLLAAPRASAGGAQRGGLGRGLHLQLELVTIGLEQLLDLGYETAGDDQGPSAEAGGLQAL